MEELLEDISDHPLLGLKRKIQFEGIEYLSRSNKEMQMVFLEKFVDAEGNIIEGMQDRRVRYHISNSETVNANGITITLERVRSAVAKKANETEEQYQERTQQIYDNQIAQGTKKFDYYITKFGLGQAIRETITIIKNENKFD